MSDINAEIKAAIDSFDMDRARELLRDALKDPDAETYYLASKVAIDHEQKQEFLEKAITADPFHEKARKAFKTTGRINTETPFTNTSNTPVQTSADSENSYVEATVTGKPEIYVLPNYRSEVRTKVEPNTIFYLISRFEDHRDSRWYQIVYNSPITTVVGWIEHIHVGNINLNGSEIQPMDLPTTEFQFNSRDSFKEITTKVTNDLLKGNFDIRFFAVGAILGIIGGIILIPYDFASGFAFGLIFSPISGVIANGFAQFRFWTSSASKLLKKEQITFHKASLAARTDLEKMQDAQVQNMALNAALNLGVNAASRMVPNKQDITVRNRR